MRRIARENVPWALAALAGCALLAWLGLQSFAWSDYETESQPALEALVHGHLTGFLRLVPAYGGSLVERAPFALIPGLWGGGALAVYRAVAVPCLLAGALLGTYLVARMRTEGRPRPVRLLALAICVVNPITLRALEVGHPEELLGASLCIAAIVLAADRRPLWAGLALGLAIANKEWALLALGPVLLALPPGRRLSCAVSAAATAGAVLAPLILTHSSGFLAATRASATPVGVVFHPSQIWWFLGHHVPYTHGPLAPPQPGDRVGPGWTSAICHPLILTCGVLVGGALRLRERRRGPTAPSTALLAFALLMLLRCVLDTWDTAYYTLPFLLAVLTWEVSDPHRRAPVLAASCTVLAYLNFLWLPAHGSADLQAALFLAWSLPLALALALRLFAPGWTMRLLRRRQSVGERAQMTVKAFESPVRMS
jgi:hypothetical protein